MKPALIILSLIVFTACSTNNRQKKACNKPVEVTAAPACQTESKEQQHLYDLPLQGIVYWVKSHLHR